MKQRRGGVCATEQTDCGLGMAQLDGELRLPALLTAVGEVGAWMARESFPASIIDYSAALLAVTMDELRAGVIPAAARCTFMPAAIVTTPWQLSLVQDYARQMREHGIPRAAFICIESAQRWAAQQAELSAAQLAHRALARISRRS
jgi:hypothetical protein